MGSCPDTDIGPELDHIVISRSSCGLSSKTWHEQTTNALKLSTSSENVMLQYCTCF